VDASVTVPANNEHRCISPMTRSAFQPIRTPTATKTNEACSAALIFVIAWLVLANLTLRMPGAVLTVDQINGVPLCGP
jgi:hypothetical protein